MIVFKTGSEPNHKVSINPNQVVYLEANGGFTWIHLSNGSKLLVDGKFDNVVLELKYWWRDHRRMEQSS